MTQDWRLRAACKGKDPELFFPVAMPGTTFYDHEVQQAQAVCAGCPVREACLLWALDSGQEYGVWGGIDEVERRAMSRQRVWR